MKKLIAWPLSRIFFWVGNIASYVINKDRWIIVSNTEDEMNWFGEQIFKIYQTSMTASFKISDWANLDYWYEETK